MPELKVYEIQYIYTMVGYTTIPATSEVEAIDEFNRNPAKYRNPADEGDTQEQIIGIQEVNSCGNDMNYSLLTGGNRLMEKHM